MIYEIDGVKWYTFHEIAKRSKFSKQLLRFYYESGKIPGKTIEDKKCFCEEEVEKLINGIKPPYKKRKIKKQSKIRIYEDLIEVTAVNTGNAFLFDKDMLPILNGRAWNERKQNEYLQTTIDGKTVFAHHLVIGKPPKGQVVDHIDRNKRNNRRNNLRFLTYSANGVNCKLNRNNTSGYKGVTWDKARNKWISRFGSKLIGRYHCPAKAATAYDRYLEEHYGDIAVTNKKLGLL